MPNWLDFGAILAVLGGPGVILGRLGRVLAPLGGLLGRLWPVLCATWRVLERLGTSWPPSSLQNRKKLEKPTKNHQKPPQHKPDLTMEREAPFFLEARYGSLWE